MSNPTYTNTAHSVNINSRSYYAKYRSVAQRSNHNDDRTTFKSVNNLYNQYVEVPNIQDLLNKVA